MLCWRRFFAGGQLDAHAVAFVLWYGSDPPGAASPESTHSAPLPTWHLLSHARALERCCTDGRALERCCTDGRYDYTLTLLSRFFSFVFDDRHLIFAYWYVSVPSNYAPGAAVYSNAPGPRYHTAVPGTYAPGLIFCSLQYVSATEHCFSPVQPVAVPRSSRRTERALT